MNGLPLAESPDPVRERLRMVELIERRGVADPAVLAAMRRVPRHLFIPEPFRRGADPYGDHPAPIGYGQTISQPYMVAYMSAVLELRPGEKVLEIGTGSGYQAAVLAEMGAEVFTLEVVPELAAHARRVLESTGYGRVRVRAGNGCRGWEEEAPFDAVLAACAPERIPPALGGQLREGGRMAIPVGSPSGELVFCRRRGGRLECRREFGVVFVPMVDADPPGA